MFCNAPSAGRMELSGSAVKLCSAAARGAGCMRVSGRSNGSRCSIPAHGGLTLSTLSLPTPGRPLRIRYLPVHKLTIRLHQCCHCPSTAARSRSVEAERSCMMRNELRRLSAPQPHVRGMLPFQTSGDKPSSRSPASKTVLQPDRLASHPSQSSTSKQFCPRRSDGGRSIGRQL